MRRHAHSNRPEVAWAILILGLAVVSELLTRGSFFPWPGLASVIAVLAVHATLAARIRRREGRAATGLCPTCGYDLRATPHRCPECGTIPAR